MAAYQTDESRENCLVKTLWLNYFNNVLYENGTISEMEYKKMVEKIAQFCTRRTGGCRG